ncbi:DciA family protein [Halorhodospira neutriphila]|uniref:DciA family protein n=1 Tax=Halorhodospira neutriphila TaxID=168379 RepID=UPI001905E710
MTAKPRKFNPAAPSKREGSLHRLAPRLAQRPGPLRAVVDHARELERLTRRLQRAAPEAVRGRWRLARLDPEEIVILAESSAWATRLRFLAPQLQDAAERLGGRRPQRVTVRVAPSAPQPRVGAGRGVPESDKK